MSRSARVIIDDARMHEVRILNLNDPRTGTIRIEKLMENERCMLMQPERSEYFLICISGNGLQADSDAECGQPVVCLYR